MLTFFVISRKANRTVENTERQRLYEGLLVRTQEEQKKRKSKKPVVDENQLSIFGFVA